MESRPALSLYTGGRRDLLVRPPRTSCLLASGRLLWLEVWVCHCPRSRDVILPAEEAMAGVLGYHVFVWYDLQAVYSRELGGPFAH